MSCLPTLDGAPYTVYIHMVGTPLSNGAPIYNTVHGTWYWRLEQQKWCYNHRLQSPQSQSCMCYMLYFVLYVQNENTLNHHYRLCTVLIQYHSIILNCLHNGCDNASLFFFFSASLSIRPPALAHRLLPRSIVDTSKSGWWRGCVAARCRVAS